MFLLSSVLFLGMEMGLGDVANERYLIGGREGEEVEFREVYTNPIRKVGKEVRYWVGVVKGEQEVVMQEMEVDGAKWVGWDEAEKTITFEEGRAMLRRARACLEAGS